MNKVKKNLRLLGAKNGGISSSGLKAYNTTNKITNVCFPKGRIDIVALSSNISTFYNMHRLLRDNIIFFVEKFQIYSHYISTITKGYYGNHVFIGEK